MVWVALKAARVAELVKTSLLAAPTVTEKVELSRRRPVLETVIVTEPAVWPVTVSEATPEEAVAVPKPVTEPAPAVCANVTTVALSVVITLLLASSTAAVKVFVAPETTLLVFEVKTSFVAAPAATAKTEASLLGPALGAALVDAAAVWGAHV